MSAPDILVVEDHDDAREMLVEWLGSLGFAPEGACNGRQALARLEAGARPPLILLDLMMPVMDGWTFLREARARGLLSHSSVWIVSAVEHLAPVDGVDGLVPKPVDLKRLRAVVEDAMPRRRTAG